MALAKSIVGPRNCTAQHGIQVTPLLRSIDDRALRRVGTGVDVGKGVDIRASLGITLAEGVDVSVADENGKRTGVNDRLGLGAMVGSGIDDSVSWGVGVGIGAAELDRAWIAFCFVPSYIPVSKFPSLNQLGFGPGRGRY